MRVFVSLDLELESINTDRSNVLFGYPTPVTYYGFLVNLLLKEDLTDDFSNIKFTYGINEFYPISEMQKGTFQDSKAGSKLLFRNKSKFSTKVVFSFDSKIFNLDLISEKIYQSLFSKRLSGGNINKHIVNVYPESEKRDAEKKLIGSLLVMQEKESVRDFFSDRESLVNLIYNKNLKKGAKNEITIVGYNFLTDLKNKEHLQKGYEDVTKEVYAESIYGFIELVPVSSRLIEDEIKYWQQEESKNYIIYNQK